MIKGNEGQNGTKLELSSPPLEQLMADIEMEFAGPENTISAGIHTLNNQAAPGKGEQFIGFSLDTLRLAVPLKTTLEVGRLPAVTPLPNLPEWVCGISNIRGEIVSVVDLSAFLGRSTVSGKSGTNLLLIGNRNMKIGFKVDRLTGIVLLSEEQLALGADPFGDSDIAPFLTGVIAVEGGLLHLLDVEKLLSSKKLNAFQKHN